VAHDWAGDFDRCPACGSVHLVRRLGEVECRDCGAVIPPAGETADVAAADGAVDSTGSGPRDGSQPSGLSEEVALALDRVLRRGVVRG
jgi:hypothetical protein